MYKLLLKKQLFEVFRSWFFDAKNNKMLSKTACLGKALLFFGVIILVFGSMSVSVSNSLCGAMLEAGVSWLYFDLFGLMAVAIGLFGSVLSTYSELYLAKDNDMLLSMPIPVGTIVAARLSVTFITGAFYSAVVFLPALAVYQLVGGFDMGALLGGVCMMLEIFALVFSLSCILAYGVAKISQRLKNRSYVSVLLSLAFVGLYYYVYYRASELIGALVLNAARYGDIVRRSAGILYVWGQNGVGNAAFTLLSLAVSILIGAVVVFIMTRSFVGITTASSSKGKTAAKGAQREKSPSGALLSKELARFTASSNYMLNCGFGVLFLLAAGVVVLIKGSDILSLIPAELEVYTAAAPVLAAFIACILTVMNNSACPSVSLEGKTLWVLQSLPVDPWDVIRAKTRLQLLLTELPMVFLCICVCVKLPFSVPEKLLFLLTALVYPVLSALFCMYVGVKKPMMTWTNEIVPIKQSFSVAVALFAQTGFIILGGGGYLLLLWRLGSFSPTLYLGLFSALCAVLSLLLRRRLKSEGAEILRTL